MHRIHEHLQVFKKIARMGIHMAFTSIYNYFKRRRNNDHSHDIHLGIGQFSRKNRKEKEEDTRPCPLLQPTPIQETCASTTFAHELRTM
jgi:hypothetical protein